MMRFAIQAAALALLAMPALAQTTPPAPDTTTAPPAAAPAAPPAAAPATPAPPKKPVGHRQTLAQRFAAVNTTHDGHVTRDQATAARWHYIIHHFAEIDVGNKGYITMDDIHAFARAQRALHPRTPAAHAPAASPPAAPPPAASPPAAPAPAAPPPNG